ncbi:hypothetical protein C8R44DRAFT_139056 [Mycena epipterygia]|nr:hypothetical protein C8R44DRAFT_139056 [Mycena epipterygia]
MTFAVLRALHAILGDALDDIERVYGQPQTSAEDHLTHKKAPSVSRAYASPPPSPSSSSFTPLVFPSLDAPYDAASAGEQLTAPPTVVAAINRIVAAAGQMAATVQVPFLSLCDAGMGYLLPSCLRLLEAAHIPEVLRHGPVHVREIAARTGVEQAKLAHILRLLATHHLLREAAPDIFATNRISSLIDTVHDFFTPQPVVDAAVFLLRVVLHDWPDAFAQRILLRLREAAAPHTRLVLADFILPVACVDDFGVGGEENEKRETEEEPQGSQREKEKEKEPQVEDAETMLAPAPLLANLGKASANAYWMDLTGRGFLPRRHPHADAVVDDRCK